MSTMLIAMNQTRESGSFCGDQLCSLKTARLFVEGQPDVDRVIMSVSPANDFSFFWDKFIDDPRGDRSIPKVELVYDNWNAGDWSLRWYAWDKWRTDRCIMMNDGSVREFAHYRELYLRIHGAQRQTVLCGHERGLGRRNIYSYWYCGQEHCPEELPPSVDWFDGSFMHHPPHQPIRDVYISPHAKTQGNVTFTFDFWSAVVHKLVDSGVTVTVGYDGYFCEDLNGHPLYKKHWMDHRAWMEEICHHKIVACGNTGTGWLACACDIPMLTVEPVNSVMSDHRYRECGLRNIVEVVSVPDADYVARRLIEEVRCVVVMTTGCYDILHAGHVRHLERSRAFGTRLVVALNSDESVRMLKGPTRPINSQAQRKEVLEALRCVDEVRIFDGPDALPLIQDVKPAVLTCGYGYTVDQIVGREMVKGWGGRAVVTYRGNATDEPSTTKVVQYMIRPSDVLEICRAGAAHSINPFDKLKLLAEEFFGVSYLLGDVADCGAYRGGTSVILRRLAPDKHLHLFDTWAGNPYDDPLCHHKKGEWAASMKDCAMLVGHNKLTHYYRGILPHVTLSEQDVEEKWVYCVRDRQFCFVYVDMDTYQSTRDAIEFFWPRLVRGGKMLFDDYGWEPCAGVQKAVDEMFPPEECERYGNSVHELPGVARRRVVQSQYACILEKQ